MVSKKVSDSVSEIFGIEKSLGFGIEKNYQKILGFVCLKHGFVKFGIGIGIGFETLLFFGMVSDLALKKFGIEKSIGFGVKKIWYRKKYRIRYQKNLVSEKSFGFRFVQIFGIVTHCLRPWLSKLLQISIILRQ